MTQKSLLHAVAAQIANGYETAEVPMYSEQLRMPDRKVIIKIIENLQKVFFPAYFAGGTVSHVSAETFAEFLLAEVGVDLAEQELRPLRAGAPGIFQHNQGRDRAA